MYIVIGTDESFETYPGVATADELRRLVGEPGIDVVRTGWNVVGYVNDCGTGTFGWPRLPVNVTGTLLMWGMEAAGQSYHGPIVVTCQDGDGEIPFTQSQIDLIRGLHGDLVAALHDGRSDRLTPELRASFKKLAAQALAGGTSPLWVI